MMKLFGWFGVALLVLTWSTSARAESTTHRLFCEGNDCYYATQPSPGPDFKLKDKTKVFGDTCSLPQCNVIEDTTDNGTDALWIVGEKYFPAKRLSDPLYVNRGDKVWSNVECTTGGEAIRARTEFDPSEGTTKCGAASVTLNPGTPDSRACDEEDFSFSRLDPEWRKKELKRFECGQMTESGTVVCVGLDGAFVGSVPELEQGRTVLVKVLAFSGDVKVSLALSFEKSIRQGSTKPDTTEKTDVAGKVGLKLVSSAAIVLHGAGKLIVGLDRSKGELTASGTQTDPTAPPPVERCSVSEDKELETSISVSGDYYVSIGVAPIYSWHREREAGTRLGLDGVKRIVDDPSDSVDVLATIAFFPTGARDTQWIQWGLVLGTSLAAPGRSWCFGPEIAFPKAGLGLIAGGAINVVDATDDGFSSGQSWNRLDDDVPTHVTAQPGFFVGVNVQDDLFKKVFKIGQ